MDIFLTVLDKKQKLKTIKYALIDNPVAKKWVEKIRRLQNVPLDSNYTGDNFQKFTIEQCEKDILSIAENFIEVKTLLENGIDKKALNETHSWLVRKQYSDEYRDRQELHTLHRLVHAWEDKTIDFASDFFSVGWGIKEGLLQTDFEVDPYEYYEQDLKIGDLYLDWSEFGKKPHTWFIDGASTNTQDFFQQCFPHKTFRAKFGVCVRKSKQNFDEGFEWWWKNSFQQAWIGKYGSDWNELKEFGAIPLATTNEYFEFNSVEGIRI